jgi:hypothetical protein
MPAREAFYTWRKLRSAPTPARRHNQSFNIRRQARALRCPRLKCLDLFEAGIVYNY